MKHSWLSCLTFLDSVLRYVYKLPDSALMVLTLLSRCLEYGLITLNIVTLKAVYLIF